MIMNLKNWKRNVPKNNYRRNANIKSTGIHGINWNGFTCGKWNDKNSKFEDGNWFLPDADFSAVLQWELSNETKDAIQVMNAMTRSKDNLCWKTKRKEWWWCVTLLNSNNKGRRENIKR
jgi:hypothetical protein